MRKQNWLIFLSFFILVPLLGCKPAKLIENPETDFVWDTGVTHSKLENRVIITKYKGESSDVVIPQKIQGMTVTMIAKEAFNNCGLTGVVIPHGVEYIGDRAFEDNNLVSVKLPEGIKKVPQSTFKNNKIVSVSFPKSLTVIGGFAFADNNIVSVKLPEGMEAVYEFAFENNKIASLSLPTTLTSIGFKAFYANNLESVIIHDGVTEIERSAFARNKISSVTLPNTLQWIRGGAFENNSLHEITLPDSVTRIDEEAFRNNKLVSITIPEKTLEIEKNAFANNPLKEIIIKAKKFRFLSESVFQPPLCGVLPSGRYVLSNTKNWLFEDSDGTLLPLQSYYEKLIRNYPSTDVLADMVYVAVHNADTEMLKDCISRGADIKGRMLNGQSNTPLAEIISGKWWWANSDAAHNRSEYYQRQSDMAAILLKAGAVPQYWMLRDAYHTPAVIRMLLERGVLSDPESDEYGELAYYERPKSLLLYYCQMLLKERDYFSDRNRLITESAGLLLKFGEDVNYRDPNNGLTPLIVAMDKSVYGVEMTQLLLKHISRPLFREEYRLLIGLYHEKVYTEWEWLSAYLKDGMAKEREDRFGFDALVLKGIRNGLLNPESKDRDGKDIFDYAVEKGTAGLMEGLLPYLLKSKRAIITINGASVNINGDGVNDTSTGLYFDAVKARNYPVAEVLATSTNHKLDFDRDYFYNLYYGGDH